MRADALRNRAKLLDAAAAQFAEAGTDSSLDAVAKRAGVGVGTLYRHFPTKEALLEAVYRNEVDQLCDAAAELLATETPDAALAAWMGRFVDFAVAKRGMGDALRTLVSARGELGNEVSTRLRAAIGLLLEAAAAAGAIRSDLDADDVLRAMGAIWLIPDEPGWQEQARRLLGLVMDGLRHRA